MSAILDEPAVRRAVWPVSVDFYHELGRLGLLNRSVELLDGIIVSKMSKSPLHASVVRRLAKMIGAALQPGQELFREDPLTLEGSEPEPDLAVVQGQESDFLDHHPSSAQLVVEVAVTSVEIDRRKAAIYARAGIVEYWLVEPEAKRITVFREPGATDYGSEQVLHLGDRLTSVALPGLSFGLANIFPA